MAQRTKTLSEEQQKKMAKKAAQVERLKTSLTSEQLQTYRKHFDLFDLNGDGSISARELRKVSRQMGYRLDDSQIEVWLLLLALLFIDFNGFNVRQH